MPKTYQFSMEVLVVSISSVSSSWKSVSKTRTVRYAIEDGRDYILEFFVRAAHGVLEGNVPLKSNLLNTTLGTRHERNGRRALLRRSALRETSVMMAFQHGLPGYKKQK